jgi:cytochrome c-type biogenesis protein CcmF
MLLVLVIGPLLRWRKDSFARIRVPVLAAAAAGIATLVGIWMWSGIAILPLLGLALAVAVGVASFLPLKGRSLRRVPLAVWGMCLAHFGVAVALFGMAADSAFQQERLVAANVGDTVEVGPWEATLASISPVAGPNWTAMQADMFFSYEGGTPTESFPQARSFWTPPQETSEVALVTRWNGQLYAAVGNMAEDGRWQLRLWWKPFVTFIWYGGMLIALGGLLALLGRVTGDLRRRAAIARGEHYDDGIEPEAAA